MTLTRRSILTAISAAAAAQAQRTRPPNWKPRLGVLMQYSDSNLEFIKSEGFTSAQLRLNPDQLDDAAIHRNRASRIYLRIVRTTDDMLAEAISPIVLKPI